MNKKKFQALDELAQCLKKCIDNWNNERISYIETE